MLDKELKAKWIAALRSGKYKQGRGQLYNKREDSYCCLGVLADIDENLTISESGRGVYITGQTYKPLVDNYDPISNRIGADNIDQLWRMNDRLDLITMQYRTFEDVADWIENNDKI